MHDVNDHHSLIVASLIDHEVVTSMSRVDVMHDRSTHVIDLIAGEIMCTSIQDRFDQLGVHARLKFEAQE